MCHHSRTDPFTNNARTTVGIGEVVDFGGMPDGTTWTVSGAGSISPTNGNGTKFTASLSPGSATVTAQIDNVTTQTTFSVVAPGSAQYAFFEDEPLGSQDPNGTYMGAKTIFAIVIEPTTVSFKNAPLKEILPPLSVTWPCGQTTPLIINGTTNAISIPCDNVAEVIVLAVINRRGSFITVQVTWISLTHILTSMPI